MTPPAPGAGGAGSTSSSPRIESPTVHVNTSSTSGSSDVWKLLSQQAAASTRSGRSAGSSEYASSSSDTNRSSATESRPPGPPPPPAGFDLSGLSTAQFAGGQAPVDPIASLDADGSGSVSSQEFGLDGASSEVQALFSAIDGDGSGELSGDEIDAFRTQMMAAEQANGSAPSAGPQGAHGGHPHPPGPPPAGGEGDASAGGTATGGSGSLDVNAFLQQLAQRYAAISAQTGTVNSTSTSTSAGTLLSASA